MATIEYTIDNDNEPGETVFYNYGSKDNAIQSLKTMAYDLLATVSDLDYSIEAMSNTSFELNILHDDGTADNHYMVIED